MNMQILNRTDAKRKEILILILCLFIGFALRFYTFDRKSLWLDEIYTFNDSKDTIKDQLAFYKKNASYLQAPLFFTLTHLFYPFTKPERDLRVIPLIFGILSIPMIYFLSRSFSPNIALPCTISLSFMTYHICLSQDGRSYSLLMFLGMGALYFLIKYLTTLKKGYLIGSGILFAASFYTSYSAIPFIVLSQILWFYRRKEENRNSCFFPFLILNGSVILLCLPWILFLAINYDAPSMIDPVEAKFQISFLNIINGILHDWLPHLPLMIASVILLFLFPFLTKRRRNAVVLLLVLILPAVGLYLFCKLFNITHFVTSKYFINFLPLFFITIYLSIDALEVRFKRLKGLMRFRLLFTILFIASNLTILPLYYRSEKQDFRGLVNYLKAHLRNGDRIFDEYRSHSLGLLHYLGIKPEGRFYHFPFYSISENEIEFRKSFIYRDQLYTIYSSRFCCGQYTADGSRLWAIVGEKTAKEFMAKSLGVFKGYFDGSFLNFNKFPTNASMYLFLWDPSNPKSEGMKMPIE